MPLMPKQPSDLALAPVAAQIDRNLARLRDLSVEQIDTDVSFQLNSFRDRRMQPSVPSASAMSRSGSCRCTAGAPRSPPTTRAYV